MLNLIHINEYNDIKCINIYNEKIQMDCQEEEALKICMGNIKR